MKFNSIIWILTLFYSYNQHITCNHSNQNMQNQYIPNIIFVGNSKVGKTTLIGKISGHYVDANSSKPTIKSDFVVKQFTIGRSSHQVKLDVRLYDQQFELAGSPPSIMRCQDIIVLVWSLTDMESYRHLGQNLKTILSIFDTSHYGPPAIVLCANKCDCTDSEIEFDLCCEKYRQYQTVKVSAIRETGLERFESIIREILLQRYNERSEKQLSISVDIEPIIVDHHEEKPNCC